LFACRHYAEHSGYWETTSFLKEESEASGELTFYDSNTGKALFYAPRNRSWADFVEESLNHGWPSFRDSEVNWDLVRCLPNGEAVSVDGTHLGHNLPDHTGNRYCINLVSVAGRPATA
jgi:peptide methionine sulfoxide reductase MsrB